MSCIKKIAKCIKNIGVRKNKNEKIEIDNSNDFEDNFAPIMMSASKDIEDNFENLFNFNKDKEFQSIVKMAEEKSSIKSKYSFGDAKDLFCAKVD